MIKDEINEIHQLAEQFRVDKNCQKIDECIDAIRLLNELISDIRVLIVLKKIRHDTKENNMERPGE